jgi:hypothetical protein
MPVFRNRSCRFPITEGRHQEPPPCPSKEQGTRTGHPCMICHLLSVFLCNPGLDQFFHQGSRQRLVYCETDSPFGCQQALQLFLELLDHGLAHGEETAVVRKGGVPHQHSFVLENRNSVTDDLGSLRRYGGPDCCADFFQGTAGGLRDPREVFVSVFGCSSALCNRTALTRRRFLHARNATPSGSSRTTGAHHAPDE